MLRNFFASALCGLLCFAFASEARAAYITTNGDVALRSGTGAIDDPFVTPLLDIKSISGSLANSKVYTNQFSGTGFVSGGVRTVSIQALASAVDGVSHETLRDPVTGQTIYAITALAGSIVAPGTASFSAGVIFLVTGASTLDERDPASFSLGNILASYALTAPDDVVAGPYGAPISFTPSALVNRSVLTPVPLRSVGQLLFGEELSGSGFISNVEHPLTGAPLPPSAEGLFVEVLQREIEFTFPGSVPNAFDAADLAFLNAVASAADTALGGGFSDLGGGARFATGLGVGPATHYNPNGGIGVGGGDFHARLEATAYIVATPEPSTMALLGIGMGAMGLVRVRRQRKQNALALSETESL